MSECSGNPNNCNFCGNTKENCAKDSVAGCSANPSTCTVCQGKGCVAVECTGGEVFHDTMLTFSDVKTCKACMGNFQTCRKSEVSPAEGVERVRPSTNA